MRNLMFVGAMLLAAGLGLAAATYYVQYVACPVPGGCGSPAYTGLGLAVVFAGVLAMAAAVFTRRPARGT